MAALAVVAWALTFWQAHHLLGMRVALGQGGMGMPMEVSVLGFMAAWLTMTAAMMLPTVAPIVLAHQSVVRHRGEGWLVTAVFVSGYLLVWTLSGLVPLTVFVSQAALPAGVLDSRWLAAVSGAIMVFGGLYQFTPLKSTCLRACRSPLGFILSHDFSKGPAGAVMSGMSHGAYCLGCCWALLSVLVVVGLMNLGWMAALSLVFFIEKNWRHGVWVDRLVGLSVALAGAAIVVEPDLLRHLSGVG